MRTLLYDKIDFSSRDKYVHLRYASPSEEKDLFGVEAVEVYIDKSIRKGTSPSQAPSVSESSLLDIDFHSTPAILTCLTVDTSSMIQDDFGPFTQSFSQPQSSEVS